MADLGWLSSFGRRSRSSSHIRTLAQSAGSAATSASTVSGTDDIHPPLPTIEDVPENTDAGVRPRSLTSSAAVAAPRLQRLASYLGTDSDGNGETGNCRVDRPPSSLLSRESFTATKEAAEYRASILSPAPDESSPPLRYLDDDNIWFNPSLEQMIEALHTTMMQNGNLASVPKHCNAYILHLIEGYRAAHREIDTVTAAYSAMTEEQERQVEMFDKAASEWERLEKQYREEIKRLEVILSRTHKEGLEAVTLARTNSVVDRRGRGVSRIASKVRDRPSQLKIQLPKFNDNKCAGTKIPERSTKASEVFNTNDEDTSHIGPTENDLDSDQNRAFRDQDIDQDVQMSNMFRSLDVQSPQKTSDRLNPLESRYTLEPPCPPKRTSRRKGVKTRELDVNLFSGQHKCSETGFESSGSATEDSSSKTRACERRSSRKSLMDCLLDQGPSSYSSTQSRGNGSWLPKVNKGHQDVSPLFPSETETDSSSSESDEVTNERRTSGFSFVSGEDIVYVGKAGNGPRMEDADSAEKSTVLTSTDWQPHDETETTDRPLPSTSTKLTESIEASRDQRSPGRNRYLLPGRQSSTSSVQTVVKIDKDI